MTAADWVNVHDLGGGGLRQSTAIGVSGRTIYAGWCGTPATLGSS